MSKVKRTFGNCKRCKSKSKLVYLNVQEELCGVCWSIELMKRYRDTIYKEGYEKGFSDGLIAVKKSGDGKDE